MYDALVANVYMFYDTSIPLVRDRSNCATRRIADREHTASVYLFTPFTELMRNSTENLIQS